MYVRAPIVTARPNPSLPPLHPHTWCVRDRPTHQPPNPNHVRRDPAEPVSVLAVQSAAAQALRPVPASVPVHRGLSTGPVLFGERQKLLPPAQTIDSAARSGPAVRPVAPFVLPSVLKSAAAIHVHAVHRQYDRQSTTLDRRGDYLLTYRTKYLFSTIIFVFVFFFFYVFIVSSHTTYEI